MTVNPQQQAIDPPSNDAIVVLGAAVWEGGIPSPSLRRRLLHGVKLLQQNQASILILSGGLGHYPPTEAKVMQRLAIAAGISNHQMILEPTATSTLESAIACTQIMRTRHWSRVVVVSDHYHLFRSVLLFRQLGVHVTGSAPDIRGWQVPRRQWFTHHCREVLALPWSLLRLWRRKIEGEIG